MVTMDFKIRTTAEHHGAEIYEVWKFPDPSEVIRGKNKEVWLRIKEDNSHGAETVSKTSVPLSEVPPRAADKFCEGAAMYRDTLDGMITELTESE